MRRAARIAASQAAVGATEGAVPEVESCLLDGHAVAWTAAANGDGEEDGRDGGRDGTGNGETGEQRA
jgi:hypothetical protein